MNFFLLRLILVFFVLALAQQSTVSPGGEISRSISTTSYSVGQSSYKSQCQIKPGIYLLRLKEEVENIVLTAHLNSISKKGS